MKKETYEAAMKAFMEEVKKDEKSFLALMSMDKEVFSNAIAAFVKKLEE